ncbi:MAG: hypothetical protein M3Q15_03450, partial [Pseudomonadota bacterium]|nr:hypothetical protein [Pseudomonadota bacterium]
VTSNRGYQLKLGFQTDAPPFMIQDTRPWMTINKATLINGTVDYCEPGGGSCTYSRTWPSLSMTGTSSFTDSMGRVTSYSFTGDRLTAIKRPGAAANNVVVAYDGSGKVSSVVRDGVTTTYAYADAAGVRTTTVNAAGPERRVVTFTLADMQRTSDEDALGNISRFAYHPTTGLPASITAPELNKTEYEFDARGNATKITSKPKPGSPLADIVRQSTYPASDTSFPERCAPGIAAAVCNRPLTSTDARGNVTDYSYDAAHGGPLTITLPAPTGGGVRPQTRYSYAPLYAWYKNSSGTLVQAPQPITRPVAVSQCMTGTSCAGAASETRTEIAWQAGSASSPSNLLPVTVTQKAGDNSLAATTTLTHDAVGDVAAIDGPLPGTADTSNLRYNLNREPVGAISPDPDGAGALKRRAQRLSYNADGQVTLTEAGTVTGITDPDWAAFVSLQQGSASYDANARPVREGVSAGGTEYQVTQHSYDARGRIDCSAVRMNSASWGSLPGDACTAAATGSFGPDRITRTSYDAVGRPIKVTSGYGTAVAADDATASYTANGRSAALTDAEGNKTSYSYDGFDRQSQSFYPSPSVKGTSSTTDYEQLSYDAASNVTIVRMRDGQGIGLSYDNLNRPTFKDLPQTVAGEWDVTLGYDNLGRMTVASDTNGQVLDFSYDALGRLTAETLNSHGAKNYQYDFAGRRTRMTWKDGLYVGYDYLVTGETSYIRENGATSGIGVLASFGYDDLGRRTSLTRGNGTVTGYAHDPVSRLASLTQDIAGSVNDLTLGFAYNPASQITTNTRSNDLYAWTGHGSGTTASSVNGLNQLVTLGAVSPSYDLKSNLYWAGGDTYGYTVE